MSAGESPLHRCAHASAVQQDDADCGNVSYWALYIVLILARSLARLVSTKKM